MGVRVGIALYGEKCFCKDYTSAQSAVAIITPASGKKLRIRYVFVSTASTTTNVVLEFATSAITVFKLYVANIQTAGMVTRKEGDIDEPLKLTCAADTFLLILYDEV